MAVRAGLRLLAALTRSRSGNAAVEFGLAAPVLVGLLVPVADLGMAFSRQVQVQQAAQAGAQYAVFNAWNNNSSTSIAGVVTSATGLSGITASPAPYQFCGCPSGSAVAAATCNSTCASGQVAGYYVVVSAQATYQPALPYSVLGSSVRLSATSTVRVR
jgi:Flp pilus assembly protein TadG